MITPCRHGACWRVIRNGRLVLECVRCHVRVESDCEHGIARRLDGKPICATCREQEDAIASNTLFQAREFVRGAIRSHFEGR